MTGLYYQPHCVTCSFILVDLHQSLAKRVNGYTHNGVGLRIKGRPPPKSFHRDRIFLDLIRPPLKVFLADVLQHPREIFGAAQHARA